MPQMVAWVQIHEDHLHPHHHLRHLSQPKHHQHHHQHPHRISVNLTPVIYSHASCHPSLLFTLIIGWITLQNEIMPRSHCEKPLAHQMRHHPEAAPCLPVLSTRAHGFRARRPRTSRARRRRCLGRSVGSGGINMSFFYKVIDLMKGYFSSMEANGQLRQELMEAKVELMSLRQCRGLELLEVQQGHLGVKRSTWSRDRLILYIYICV